MTDYIESCLSFINQWILSPAAALVLLFAGIVLSVKLKFFHLKNPAKLAKLMFEKKSNSSHSPFRALTVALAGTLGVGNISGVALALSYGGAGSIFWMWVSALCSMIVKYSEIVLAVYHRDVRDGKLQGGAMYYIKHGLRKKGLSSLLAVGFACFCIFSSLSTGSIIQVNAFSEAFEGCYQLKTVDLGDGVRTIGENAFAECVALEKVEMGNHVENIYYRSFAYCRSLKSIRLSDTVLTIGDSAFAGCTSLKEIYIGSRVTNIGTSVFSGCTDLKIYYDGTQEQWDTIQKRTGLFKTEWDSGLNGYELIFLK